MRAGRSLLLLRHAKSSWADEALDDIDRPLATRGLKAAPLMGREMLRRGWVPDLALVSPAVRTRQTYALAAAQWPAVPPSVVDEAIYEAQAPRILAAIRATDDAVRTLLVVGHNPGLEDLAALLAAPQSDAEAAAAMRMKFPTAAVAHLSLAGRWSELDRRTATLEAFVTPAMLRP